MQCQTGAGWSLPVKGSIAELLCLHITESRPFIGNMVSFPISCRPQYASKHVYTLLNQAVLDSLSTAHNKFVFWSLRHAQQDAIGFCKELAQSARKVQHAAEAATAMLEAPSQTTGNAERALKSANVLGAALLLVQRAMPLFAQATANFSPHGQHNFKHLLRDEAGLLSEVHERLLHAIKASQSCAFAAMEGVGTLGSLRLSTAGGDGNSAAQYIMPGIGALIANSSSLCRRFQAKAVLTSSEIDNELRYLPLLPGDKQAIVVQEAKSM